MFQPIKLARTAETVVKQVRRAVADGLFKPGDQLPGERQLAEQFSVSRTCVREALRIMEAMGMVEVRQGRGAFVTSDTYGIENPTIWLPWITAHRDEIITLLDVRDAIEGKVAALAAARAQAADVVAAQQCIDQALVDDVAAETAHSLDVRFHDILARAGGNHLLAKMSISIGGAMAMDRLAVFAIPGRIERSAREHQDILTAIAGGDADKARQAMTRHIEGVKADVIRIEVRSETT